MALVVVAAANPLRRGVALRPARTTVVATGAAGALVVLVALAALATVLVNDVIRVAAPSFVVGAGLVVSGAALGALIRLAKGAPGQIPGLGGAWRMGRPRRLSAPARTCDRVRSGSARRGPRRAGRGRDRNRSRWRLRPR